MLVVVVVLLLFLLCVGAVAFDGALAFCSFFACRFHYAVVVDSVVIAVVSMSTVLMESRGGSLVEMFRGHQGEVRASPSPSPSLFVASG